MSKRFLMVAVLLALPATVLAQDWKGITTDWDDIATNWSANPVNAYQTAKASFDPGDVAWYGGTKMPIIDASVNTEWGYARIRNGAVITQTGGSHRWMNGTGTSNWGMNLYAGSTLDMTGGTHTTDRAAIGYYGMSGQFYASGTGTINIWGTGEFRVRENPYVAGLYDLAISDGSLIDIRDAGVLEVPVSLYTTVMDYMDANKIVAGEAGTWLEYSADASALYITAVPEPASLLLLAVGGLLLRRRGT